MFYSVPCDGIPQKRLLKQHCWRDIFYLPPFVTKFKCFDIRNDPILDDGQGKKYHNITTLKRVVENF